MPEGLFDRSDMEKGIALINKAKDGIFQQLNGAVVFLGHISHCAAKSDNYDEFKKCLLSNG